ncbi:GNAT family N-acetyltransferase [Paraburkholderia fungorum]|uniref:GNAT family N-acetyltransferase n=1 Tax=Paraburkholderia fungorum TaxID=134537 RepID=UPI0038BBF33A
MATESYSKPDLERAEDCPSALPPATALSSRPGTSTAYSIFHERWWLDIATGGHWGTATVMHGNQVLGEMPYYLARKGMWRVSRLPPLTRTLGPVIKPVGTDPVREFRHRMRVTSRLIEQLPHFDSFFQVFDHRVNDALAFALRGFTVSARYTFHIYPDCTAPEVWARMSSKTRNVVRNAATTLTVRPVEAPSEFLRFYEANLASRSRTNAYGTAIMRELVNGFVDRRAGHLLGAYDRCGKLAGVIGVVWDRHSMYYLLSSRAPTSPGGAVSLLIWFAIQEAIDRKLTFDFDGFSGATTFDFLNGFGGTLKQRLGVERLSMVYSLARTLKHGISPQSREVFTPNL